MIGIPEHGHEAVMAEEVLELLGLGSSGGGDGEEGDGGWWPRILMDCTVGRGGHAVRIAEAMARRAAMAEKQGRAERDGPERVMLIAMDVDPVNLAYARQRIEAALAGAENLKETRGSEVREHGRGRVELRTFHANFAEAPDVLEALGLAGVDALLADFGVATNQLLEGRHGLSFSAETALDMRLDPRIRDQASDLLAHWDEKRLATVLHDYAQERFARRIARKIVQTRTAEPILTTGQLARLVRSVVPASSPRHGPGGRGMIDPATRTFQALRMAVNSEVENMEELLRSVPTMMNRRMGGVPAGRAVFLSFHSGEDRLVKQAIRGWEQAGVGEALTKKPLEPGDAETNRNPRSRSAKLRAVRFHGTGERA